MRTGGYPVRNQKGRKVGMVREIDDGAWEAVLLTGEVEGMFTDRSTASWALIFAFDRLPPTPADARMDLVVALDLDTARAWCVKNRVSEGKAASIETAVERLRAVGSRRVHVIIEGIPERWRDLESAVLASGSRYV